jgi:hypothetical protein
MTPKTRDALQFRDAIHFVTFNVVIGDWEKFTKIVQKHYPQFSEDKKDGKMFFIGGRDLTVCIFLSRLDVPTLAHEAVHATNAVFDFIGSEFGLKTDEQFAYYVQWIVGTIYHNMRAKK